MRATWPKWHYLYFVLAAFDVFSVSAGLYLSQSIMSIYTRSVDINQTWAARAQAYSHLGQLAAAVNAPGNDVFDTHDVDTETARMEAALRAFQQQFGRLRGELQANVAPDDAKPLLVKLDSVDAATQAMTDEAHLIFSYFRKRLPERAGERMATMDKRYAAVNSALADLREGVAVVQQRNFERQMAAAAMQEKYEYLIGILILLMVCGATLYGYRMTRQSHADMAERERHLQEIAEARDALQETHQRLQALFKRMLEAQEAQRQHIARELHEEVAQMLGSLKMRLSSLPLTPAMSKRVAPQVMDAGTIAEKALRRLQDLARDLTPHGMDFLGLAGVLVVHVKEWTQGSGLAVHFSEQLPQQRAPFEIETAAYRVAEEAVANVVLHASAQNLRVGLRQAEGALQLRVTDDGVGFDVEAARRGAALGNSVGITMMEQRTAVLGGKLEIVSAPGRGTSVTAIFPVPAGRAA